MNTQNVESQVRQEAVKLKKDLDSLKEERVAQLERFETNITQAADDLTTWVEENVTQLSQGIENLTDDARESAKETAAMLKKDVRRGLRQYNAKAQEVAGKVPGGLAKKAVKYPWVAISIALMFGLVLGAVLKPSRRIVEEF